MDMIHSFVIGFACLRDFHGKNFWWKSSRTLSFFFFGWFLYVPGWELQASLKVGSLFLSIFICICYYLDFWVLQLSMLFMIMLRQTIWKFQPFVKFSKFSRLKTFFTVENFPYSKLSTGSVYKVILSDNWSGEALTALKNAVVDGNSVLQSWDSNLPDPCTWFHVTCDDGCSVTRVWVTHTAPPSAVDRGVFLTPLCVFLMGPDCIFMRPSDLGNANLSGQLVPALGQLPNLQYL